jgi:hypothetical protein
MAKRRRRKRSGLDAVAIAAGSTLGSIATQLDALNRKRNEISIQIRDLVRQAESQLKGMAGVESPFPRGEAKPVVKTTTNARRKMSAKARKAISDAQKKRWAAKKDRAKKGSTE